MTVEEVKANYRQIINKENEVLKELKNKIFRVGTLRLIIVISTIIGCYFLWHNTIFVLGIVLFSIIVFCVLMKLHNRLFIRKRYSELRIDNAEKELRAIDYDFSAFDGGQEYIDGRHSYSLDLDLFGNRSFFQSLNRTVTSYGKNALAHIFQFPFDKKEDIERQQQAINELSRNVKLLSHFRIVGQMHDVSDINMEMLGEKLRKTKQLSRTFWRYMPYLSPTLYIIVCLLVLCGVPKPLPVSFIALWWGMMLFVSLIPLKAIKDKLALFDKNIKMLDTYYELFKIIENESFSSPVLVDLQKKIKKEQSASLAIRNLKNYSSNFDQSLTVIGFLFLNPVFFGNIIYGVKIEKWIDRHEADIQSWFEVIGEFDALVSLSMYAYNHPDYVYPQIADSFCYEAKDLGHPMLNRNICVRNDVAINKSPYFLVVTGANMAGKSTYLRTVAINMVLASVGSVVCASAMRIYPYHLVTNLRTSDSLADSESYFFAELKRLKMIIDRLQSGEQLFIILDEILKGTNSEDKQKGSLALMKQLVANGGNGIIATHDLVLGNLETEYLETVKNYRFEADITNDHLSFSYKIRVGVAQNMNACFLMKKMGITGL